VDADARTQGGAMMDSAATVTKPVFRGKPVQRVHIGEAHGHRSKQEKQVKVIKREGMQRKEKNS
jgi:hypothetical protein